MIATRALPWNGLKVVSTFSGAGGSCLGFKMAAYRVLWASEFIPAAQETYRANYPDTILDTRDIREVKPEEILETTKLTRGELDVFEGSPPCASFSTAGKRESGWGKVKQYSDTIQRTDDLFFEYVRLLRGLNPKVFVAENVSGLVKGTAKGYFLEILAELKRSGYRVRAKLLDAQWLGVPQARQRIIFMGVREDIALDPTFPEPLSYRYSVRDALPWIRTVEGGNGFNQHAAYSAVRTAATIQQSRALNVEAESDMSRHATGDEWERMKRPGTQSEKYFQLVRPALNAPCPTVTQLGGNAGIASVCHPTEKRKFSIAELKRICAFPEDFVLTGSYVQQWERLGRSVPPLMMKSIAEVVRDRILARIPRLEERIAV